MIIQGQAVMIPKFGKFPNLMDGENFSAFEVVTLAPFVNPFFRPEEQHRRSGEDHVVKPMGEGDGVVDQQHVTLPQGRRDGVRERLLRPKSLTL